MQRLKRRPLYSKIHLRVSWWSTAGIEGGTGRPGRGNRLIRRIFNLTCCQSYFSQSHVCIVHINLYVRENNSMSARRIESLSARPYYLNGWSADMNPKQLAFISMLPTYHFLYCTPKLSGNHPCIFKFLADSGPIIIQLYFS